MRGNEHAAIYMHTKIYPIALFAEQIQVIIFNIL